MTDEAGDPVSGLTADDFEITERGQVRQISTFDAVDLPIERQIPDLADSDVVTNEGEGRMYLIVLDAMTAETGMKAKRMMRTFFADHFGPRDVAAVMLLDRGHTQSGQDFTSNRRLLIKGSTASWKRTLLPRARLHPSTRKRASARAIEWPDYVSWWTFSSKFPGGGKRCCC